MKIMTAIIALLTLISCAGVGPMDTPSGNPEVTIKSTDASRIKGAIVALYSGEGYGLVSDSQFNLVFAKQIEQKRRYAVVIPSTSSQRPHA
jgi:hypothetical protein